MKKIQKLTTEFCSAFAKVKPRLHGAGPMVQQACRTGRRCHFRALMMAIGAVLIAGLGQSAVAASLCVIPGISGCYSTIGAAVAAAMPNSTILAAPGTYDEDVMITKPLALIGANSASTIINASGEPNGIYVDGMDNPGLSGVVVSGFTVEDAEFEGVLVTNASSVTLLGNIVVNNNKNYVPGSGCAGLKTAEPFDTAEGQDCGEGIHLVGVDHSSVASNMVEHNAGGILLSDETGPTFSNLVASNTVEDNIYDCGITLASHPPAVADVMVPFGIYDNNIAGNVSAGNGTYPQGEGAGAGVGLFSPLPYGRVSGNVVSGNRLMGNGGPGVALHSHTQYQNLNDNVITANIISGNGADNRGAPTPGTTGINVNGTSNVTGTVISHNTIQNEDADIVVNTNALVKTNLNNLLGGNGTYGVYNGGSGTVNARQNWWGCASGPASGASGCSTEYGSVFFAPWLLEALP